MTPQEILTLRVSPKRNLGHIDETPSTRQGRHSYRMDIMDIYRDYRNEKMRYSLNQYTSARIK